MSFKTTISEDDFPTILSSYDVGEYRGFQTFANGAGQTTVLLETNEGKFVLRYYENRSDKHVGFEVQLLVFLMESQYPVPAIIKNRSGEYVCTYHGKPCILIEFIEGDHAQNPNEQFDTHHASQVVKAVAQLHNITDGYRPEYLADREAFDTAYCWRQFQTKHRELIDTEVGSWFETELENLKFPPDLPQGLCHADLNFGNFLFKEGAIVAVLDFDMSFFGPLIYDVASLIYWWAMPPGRPIRVEAAHFIISEYEKQRPLSDNERTHILDALRLIVLLGISWGDQGEIEDERRKIALLDAVIWDFAGS